VDQDLSTFAGLVAQAEDFRDERDWRQYHSAKNLAAAIAVEAAELQEVLLWSDEADADMNADTRQRLEEELADVMIQCANLALAIGIDIPKALAAKLEQNRSKYPVEKSRGNAKKYTNL
jgi:dCTP diphosphatase